MRLAGNLFGMIGSASRLQNARRAIWGREDSWGDVFGFEQNTIPLRVVTKVARFFLQEICKLYWQSPLALLHLAAFT